MALATDNLTLSREIRGRRFLFVLLAALAVRLFVLARYYCISSDGVVYLRAAEHFYSGAFASGFASIYPPGYPLVVALVYPLIGDWELAGQLLSLVFGVAILLPLCGLLRQVFDERVALLAGFLAAISPYLVLYSVHVRSESLYLFLTTAVIYLSFRACETHSSIKVFCGGLLAGYAYLVRPEAIAFLILIPAMLAARWLVWKHENFASFTRSVTVFSLGFLLFALPFIVYLSVDTGKFGAISRKAGVTLAINLKEAGLLESENIPDQGDLDSVVFTEFVRNHPFLYLKKVLSDVIPAVGAFFEALYYSYVPFLLIGLFMTFRDRLRDEQKILLLGFIAFFIWGFALIYVKRRYALQAVPVSLGWVAWGMWFAWEWLQRRYKARSAWLAAVCGVSVFFGVTLPKTLKAVSQEKAYVREAGRYLRELNFHGELKVAVVDERIGFYAGAKTVSLVDVEPADLSAKLLKEEPAYLAVESKTLQRLFPNVAAKPERYGLKLEKLFVGTRKDRLFLYRISQG